MSALPLRILAYLLLTAAIGKAQSSKLNTFKIRNTADLKAFFRYTPDRVPLMCGHRGGATDSYPENAIATLEYTLSKTPAFFEVDPRLTKDSVMVILHDATLDRTTTGKGKLSDYTWEEVKKLRLKDPSGKVTKYGVHTLDEVLQWSKGKTVLMIDKKDVPLPMLLGAITKNKAESHVLVSAYDVEEAKYYHKHNKNILFEAFIKNQQQLDAYAASGIPWENIVAYFGQPKKPEFYKALHEKGVMCIVYTATVLEKNVDQELRIKSYQDVIRNGADILLSDRVLEVAAAIKQFEPAKSRKWRFFNRRKPQ